jgi:hypothetical protein
MPLVAQSPPPASAQIICLDSLGAVTAAAAAELAAMGFVAIGRYVNIQESAGGFAISPDELNAIARWMGCWAIQEGRAGGWSDAA